MTSKKGPQSYYGGKSELWACVFPGKMGISWKLAHHVYGTREESMARAEKNANVVAIPLALWRRYREYEDRSMMAEAKLLEVAKLRLDYNEGRPVFIDLEPKETPTSVRGDS